MTPEEFYRIWKSSKLSADQIGAHLGDAGQWRARKVRRYAEGVTKISPAVAALMRKLDKNPVCKTCKRPL